MCNLYWVNILSKGNSPATSRAPSSALQESLTSPGVTAVFIFFLFYWCIFHVSPTFSPSHRFLLLFWLLLDAVESTEPHPARHFPVPHHLRPTEWPEAIEMPPFPGWAETIPSNPFHSPAGTHHNLHGSGFRPPAAAPNSICSLWATLWGTPRPHWIIQRIPPLIWLKQGNTP